jgi:hypothetical protein
MSRAARSKAAAALVLAASMAAACTSASPGDGSADGGAAIDASADANAAIDASADASTAIDASADASADRCPLDAGPADDAATDAATDAAPPMDASAPCDPTKPFGDPHVVKELSSPGHDGAVALSADGRTAYVSALRSDLGATTWDLYVATRHDTQSPFSPPERLDDLSTPDYAEFFPTLSADGRTLIYTSTAPGGSGGWDLRMSTRASLSDAFGAGAPITAVNSARDEWGPFLTADGNNLYMTSTRSGTGAMYVTARSDAGDFGEPKLVEGIEPAGVPVVTADGRTIYFASARTDLGAHGKTDIWIARRASTSDDFGPPVNVDELNTGESETPSWLSPDQCELYFHRMGGPIGKTDIFVARKPR